MALAQTRAPLRGNLSFAAVAGESGKAQVRGAQRDYTGPQFDGGGSGVRHLLDVSDLPDAVIIKGPSGCQVVNANTGYLMVKISILGRAIYQASKVPGFDATSTIDLACRVVQAIAAWEPSYRERHKRDCGLGMLYPNVTIGAIEGGWPYKPAHAPGVCDLYVDLRVPPRPDPEAALAELDGAVAAALSGTAGRFELEVYQHHARAV